MMGEGPFGIRAPPVTNGESRKKSEVTPCLKRKKTEKNDGKWPGSESDNFIRGTGHSNKKTYRNNGNKLDDHDFQNDQSHKKIKRSNSRYLYPKQNERQWPGGDIEPPEPDYVRIRSAAHRKSKIRIKKFRETVPNLNLATNSDDESNRIAEYSKNTCYTSSSDEDNSRPCELAYSYIYSRGTLPNSTNTSQPTLGLKAMSATLEGDSLQTPTRQAIRLTAAGLATAQPMEREQTERWQPNIMTYSEKIKRAPFPYLANKDEIMPYLMRFEKHAEDLNLTDHEIGMTLLDIVKGADRQCIERTTHGGIVSYTRMKTQLMDVHNEQDIRQTARQKFTEADQHKQESTVEFARRLEVLYGKGYPNSDAITGNHEICQKFIQKAQNQKEARNLLHNNVKNVTTMKEWLRELKGIFHTKEPPDKEEESQTTKISTLTELKHDECTICHKTSHATQNCNYKGPCFMCGSISHVLQDCPRLDTNLITKAVKENRHALHTRE